MYHTIYQTTNLKNGKIYIGYHQTENVYDDYIGSGKALKCAIKHYGREHFLKDILFVFDNKEEALDKEKEIVTEEFVARKDTYNMTVGGSVPPSPKGKKPSDLSIQMLRARSIGNTYGRKNKGRKYSDEQREKMKQVNIIPDWTGKKHSEETKAKMREQRKGRIHSEETKAKMRASHSLRLSNIKEKIQ